MPRPAPNQTAHPWAPSSSSRAWGWRPAPAAPPAQPGNERSGGEQAAPASLLRLRLPLQRRQGAHTSWSTGHAAAAPLLKGSAPARQTTLQNSCCIAAVPPLTVRLSHQNTALMMRPPTTTMPIRPRSDTPQPSTPGGRLARICGAAGGGRALSWLVQGKQAWAACWRCCCLLGTPHAWRGVMRGCTGAFVGWQSMPAAIPCPAHLGEDLHGAAGEDERHVGAQAEQGVELLGLIHGGDLKVGAERVETRGGEAVGRVHLLAASAACNAGCGLHRQSCRLSCATAHTWLAKPQNSTDTTTEPHSSAIT